MEQHNKQNVVFIADYIEEFSFEEFTNREYEPEINAILDGVSTEIVARMSGEGHLWPDDKFSPPIYGDRVNLVRPFILPPPNLIIASNIDVHKLLVDYYSVNFTHLIHLPLVSSLMSMYVCETVWGYSPSPRFLYNLSLEFQSFVIPPEDGVTIAYPTELAFAHFLQKYCHD